ncbi:MAG: hypothetical protein WA782_06030 [Sulfitobacter sp.]
MDNDQEQKHKTYTSYASEPAKGLSTIKTDREPAWSNAQDWRAIAVSIGVEKGHYESPQIASERFYVGQ